MSSFLFDILQKLSWRRFFQESVVSVERKAAEISPSVPVIRLEELRRIYQMGGTEVRALDGLDLTVERGSFWSIMGASGSGKSTLLNLLGCLDRPSSGRYFLEGEDVSELDDDSLSDRRLRHMGFVFQSFNLLPQLTVLENIELPMFYLGITPEESRDRASDLANRVGLGDRLTHKPTELSGGQCQRVAIARALANDPSLILADEPTGNLDSKTGDQIMDLLRELHSQGKTLIIVTHEEEVASIAMHQLRLRDGKRMEDQ